MFIDDVLRRGLEEKMEKEKNLVLENKSVELETNFLKLICPRRRKKRGWDKLSAGPGLETTREHRGRVVIGTRNIYYQD